MEIVLFFHLHTTDLAAMKRLNFILKECFLFLYCYFFMRYCFFVFTNCKRPASSRNQFSILFCTYVYQSKASVFVEYTLNLLVWPVLALPSCTRAYSCFGLCGHGLYVSILCGHHLHREGCVRFWQIIFSCFGNLELKCFSVLFVPISQRKFFTTIWLGLVHENLRMRLHILYPSIIQRPCTRRALEHLLSSPQIWNL